LKELYSDLIYKMLKSLKVGQSFDMSNVSEENKSHFIEIVKFVIDHDIVKSIEFSSDWKKVRKYL